MRTDLLSDRDRRRLAGRLAELAGLAHTMRERGGLARPAITTGGQRP